MGNLMMFECAEHLIKNAPIGIHFVDANGVILWANQQALQNLGYSEAEFLNRPIADFHDDPQVSSDILNKVADFNGVQNYPAKLIHKNKNILYSLVSANAYKEDGEFKHTRSFTTLISKEAYDIFRKELVIKNNFKLNDK